MPSQPAVGRDGCQNEQTPQLNFRCCQKLTSPDRGQPPYLPAKRGSLSVTPLHDWVQPVDFINMFQIQHVGDISLKQEAGQKMQSYGGHVDTRSVDSSKYYLETIAQWSTMGMWQERNVSHPLFGIACFQTCPRKIPSAFQLLSEPVCPPITKGYDNLKVWKRWRAMFIYLKDILDMGRSLLLTCRAAQMIAPVWWIGYFLLRLGMIVFVNIYSLTEGGLDNARSYIRSNDVHKIWHNESWLCLWTAE